MTTTEQEREAEKALDKIKQAQDCGDTEQAHHMADGALCDFVSALGYAGLVEEWKRVSKWYA
ncbi:hypothetical protein [Agrobacterium tumefaciens]|uniref:hypothetical protein n=1 Tax=Agrobacterium tumefaciens TaxID=358 RepID=UPI0021CED83D|nr:hypothetical protein [Agrobacterium tumefaciens]UXT11281.1 hypothetical protein FY141_00685 [Agrobacterium tumefaciens]UXT72036.1 hypothetical protein FY132_00685 [Agrobacterium tumefaciens]